jgi:exodeoxyribonuclease III
MRLVTWNVNSVRARLDRVVAWLKKTDPDVACLQELKCEGSAFPREAFEAIGYKAAVHGQKTYNGVAILAKEAPQDVVVGFDGDPEPAHARAIAATAGGLRVLNLYVPNGQEVGSPKYDYKLRWLDALREHVKAATPPPDVVCGDFNVAPDDKDVHDPEKWRDAVLCSEPERARFRALLDAGYLDGLREVDDAAGVFTWWDYRAMSFQRKAGLRIDHVLVRAPLKAKLRSVVVDREERKGEGPSDHAPVTAEFDV